MEESQTANFPLTSSPLWMGYLLIDPPDQGLPLTLAWQFLLLQVKAAATFKKPPQDTSTGNLDCEERPALRRQNPGATSLVLQRLVRPWAEDPSSWPVPHPCGSSASSLYSPVTGQSQKDFGVWPKHIFAPLLHENLPENTLMCPHLLHRHWMQIGQAASLPLPGHAQPLTPLNLALGRKLPPKTRWLPNAHYF